MSEVEELKRSNNSIEKKKRRKKRSQPKDDDSLESPRSEGDGDVGGATGDELSESSVSTHNTVPRAKRVLVVGINSPVSYALLGVCAPVSH